MADERYDALYVPAKGEWNRLKVNIAPRFCWYREKGMWWFRIFGYGIHYRNIRLHPPLFSDREGITKVLKISNHWFKLLKGW
jgi:hypothetical protein